LTGLFWNGKRVFKEKKTPSCQRREGKMRVPYPSEKTQKSKPVRHKRQDIPGQVSTPVGRRREGKLAVWGAHHGKEGRQI